MEKKTVKQVKKKKDDKKVNQFIEKIIIANG